MGSTGTAMRVHLCAVLVMVEVTTAAAALVQPAIPYKTESASRIVAHMATEVATAPGTVVRGITQFKTESANHIVATETASEADR